MGNSKVKKKSLSRLKSGMYVRTVGLAINGNGKVAPRKFLLGKDEQLAQITVLKLAGL